MGIWLCEDNCESYGAKMALDDYNTSQNDKELIDNVNTSQYDLHGELSYIDHGCNVKMDGLANVGSQSTMSVVSIRSEKMVGVGEGGAILSKDAALVSKARWWCSRAPVRGCGLWRVYEHESIGQNFRLPELLGAVGLAAVENLPVMIQRKRQIHDWYRKYLLLEDSPSDENATKLSDFLVLQTPKS